MAKSEQLPWWHGGVQFECTGSGKCCLSRGSYGYVYLTSADRRRLASSMGLSQGVFTRRFCVKVDGAWAIRDLPGATECRFLEGRGCSVYEARPTQCRTWPFWPELMSARRWQRDVADFCPGVGRGRRWSREEIESQLALQSASEE